MTDHVSFAAGSGFALGTFASGTQAPFVGIVMDDQVFNAREVLQSAGQSLGSFPANVTLFDLLQDWSANLAALEQAVGKIRAAAGAFGNLAIPVSQVRTLAPVAFPRQILCAGANYFQHVVQLLVDQGGKGGLPGTEGMDKTQLREYATSIMMRVKESGEPYFFNKPVSTIIGPNDSIRIPASAKQPDWELELGVYIGRAARHVKAADAWNYVAGYTIVNDITDRVLLWRRDAMKAMGTDWVSGKSAPTYLPTGPYLVPAAYVSDPQNLRLTLKLNGEVKQNELTSDMVHGIPRLIEYISSRVQLYPGDLICTGSPAGNGTHYNRYLQPGDVVESTISGLGVQRNQVVAESI